MTRILADTDPATTPQIELLHSLFDQKMDPAKAAECHEWLNTHRLSKATASDRITKLMSQPDVDALDVGMYKVGEAIYKVQRAVHGSGHLYAKRLTEDGFEYEAGAIRKIRASDRLTLDEAKAYGKVTGQCCVCGRTLTNESSIEAGIGPVCSGKF